MSKQQPPEYIQIEAGEDVTSIRDRLAFIRGRRVLLIWPEQGSALPRKLDLVLIQREAKRRALQIALVTHDEAVIQHAQELNISTFETISASERNRWKRGRTKVFIQRYHRPEDEPEPQDLMPFVSRIYAPTRHLPAPMQAAIRMVTLGTMIGMLLAIALVVVPSATITFQLQEEVLNVSTQIIADPNAVDVDIDNGIIPARILQANVTTEQQIATTGVQQLQDSRATGNVTFINNSSRTLTIPEGTRISTSGSNAVEFVTRRSVTVNSDSRTDVPIEAAPEFGGEVGNVIAGTINLILDDLLATNLSVQNALPTAGGLSQTLDFVTQADRDALMGRVRAQLQSEAYLAMQSQISDQQVIVIETISIPEDGTRDDWTTYSHQVGDVSEYLSLSMRAIVQAFAIDDELAEPVVFGQLSAMRPPQMVIRSESFIYTRGAYQRTQATGIVFEAFGDGVAIAQVNVDELRSELTAMSINQAYDTIRDTVPIASGTVPEIRVSPRWFGRMPIIPVRINIQVENQP